MARKRHLTNARSLNHGTATMKRIITFFTGNRVSDNRVRREAETVAEAVYQVTAFSNIAPQDVPRLGWQERTELPALPVEPSIWLRRDEVVKGLLARTRRTIARDSEDRKRVRLWRDRTRLLRSRAGRCSQWAQPYTDQPLQVPVPQHCTQALCRAQQETPNQACRQPTEGTTRTGDARR
jgi:hypothetical protein